MLLLLLMCDKMSSMFHSTTSSLNLNSHSVAKTSVSSWQMKNNQGLRRRNVMEGSVVRASV